MVTALLVESDPVCHPSGDFAADQCRPSKATRRTLRRLALATAYWAIAQPRIRRSDAWPSNRYRTALSPTDIDSEPNAFSTSRATANGLPVGPGWIWQVNAAGLNPLSAEASARAASSWAAYAPG